jgi:Mg2+-importing ATPase
VAVGLTPEMLPMIVTVNLSKGAIAMSRKKVIVKRLNSIQNFGAMDILCTDKTGTLTQDKIVLERHVSTSPTARATDVLRYAYMNSYLPDRSVPRACYRRQRRRASGIERLWSRDSLLQDGRM